MSEDEGFYLFGIPIPDSLGYALEEIIDLPWYVAFFWATVGMAVVCVVLLVVFVASFS